jgi:hypothetical protein
MNLKEILIIPGRQGLYKFISQGKNGIIVESLSDKSRIPVFASIRTTTLDNICIYTQDSDMPIEQVFKRIVETTNKNKITHTETWGNDQYKKYMEDLLPQYDKHRVYVSDIKRLISWYNLLLDNDVLSFEAEKEEPEPPTEEKQ